MIKGASKLINSHIKQFDKYADEYTYLNIIQKDVADELVLAFDTNDKSIIDIGCGSGEIYKRCKNMSRFVGVDISEKMLKLHPSCDNVTLINGNFDHGILDGFDTNSFDIAFSSSALQWSLDIHSVLMQIVNISSKSAVAVFCSGTFETIRKTAGVSNFLPIASDLICMLESMDFNRVYTKKYRLNFENTLEAFRYIKKCGVSGGEKKLDYKESINLIKNYPLGYLEFEVVFGFRNMG